MKIISKFKDYYDNISYYGVDNSIMYIRNSTEVDIPEYGGEQLRFPTINTTFKEPDYKINVIGFCGKFYLCYTFVFEYKGKIHSAYSTDEIYVILNHYKRKKSLENWEYKGKWRSFTKNNLDDSFNSINSIDLLNEDLFFKFKTPIISIGDFSLGESLRKITLNPNLKSFGFERIVNPPQAYQQVSSYISGVIGTPNKEITTISDRDQLFKKGFNDKSFKTDSPGKKKKRRSKRK